MLGQAWEPAAGEGWHTGEVAWVAVLGLQQAEGDPRAEATRQLFPGCPYIYPILTTEDTSPHKALPPAHLPHAQGPGSPAQQMDIHP